MRSSVGRSAFRSDAHRLPLRSGPPQGGPLRFGVLLASAIALATTAIAPAAAQFVPLPPASVPVPGAGLPPSPFAPPSALDLLPDPGAAAAAFLCQSRLDQGLTMVRLLADAGPVYADWIFDDVAYIGFNWIGAYIIRTTAGLILIDSLTSTSDAADTLVPALIGLGLDPADIRYVVVTHGHFDHFGGAAYLQRTYGAQVVMSAADFALAESRGNAQRTLQPSPVPDVLVEDGGGLLSLGLTTLTLMLTPGHTPGTISILLPVTWQGIPHTIAIAGGSAQPPDAAELADFRASFLTFWQAGLAAGAEGALNTHPFMLGAIERVQAMDRLGPADTNPFLLGSAGWDAYMRAQAPCIGVTNTPAPPSGLPSTDPTAAMPPA